MTDQSVRPQALVGALLVLLGVVGFFYNGDFTSNRFVHDDMLGAFSVNGWHNLLHIGTGVLLLSVESRALVTCVGALYLALGAWGLALGAGHSILSLVPVNAADDVLHLAIGIAALAIGAMSSGGR